MKLRIVTSGCFALLLLVFAVVPMAHSQGSWTPRAPVQPLPTESMAVGGVGQVIVAAYGYSAGDTNLTRLYDISSDSWTLGAPAPMPPRADAALGESTQGGFFYVAGGRSTVLGNAVLPNLERYDPVTNIWTTLAPMPTARAGAAIATFDNSL